MLGLSINGSLEVKADECHWILEHISSTIFLIQIPNSPTFAINS